MTAITVQCAVPVMNTIPLTFNEHQINATILGGWQCPSFIPRKMGIILLNSSASVQRMQILESLIRQGFEYIVSIEKDPKNYNLEEFSRNFPSVKFIIPLEEVNDGECINLGMADLSTEYVMVLRDTLKLKGEVISPGVAETFMDDEWLCTVPRLMKKNGSPVAATFIPSVDKSHFHVIASNYISENVKTFYPFDNIGLYNRQKFIQLGGFDYTIKNSYYQNLDFSMRAWLWGEKIRLTPYFSLQYDNEVPAEDSTPGLDSTRFYLKNLLPRFVRDHGEILKRSFLRFYFWSRSGLMAAMEQFSEARGWVESNKYRFKTDAGQLIEKWENIK